MRDFIHFSKLTKSRSGRFSLFPQTLLFLLVGSVSATTAAGANLPSQRAPSGGLGLPFAIADLDGDLRPDVAGIQVGQTRFSRTEYWIELQLSAAGRQRILVVGPAGGLQIAARDVNGDQALDLVLTTIWLNQPVAVLLNDGHGSFSRVDPSAFPEALSESKTNWGSDYHPVTDAVSVPLQWRVGICRQMARVPHGRSQRGAIPPQISGLPLSSFLWSHTGRSPPA